MRRAWLYLDAARAMRAEQVAWRLRRLVPPRLLAPSGPRPWLAEWRPVAAGLGAGAAPASGPAPRPEGDGEFHAVGRRRSFDEPGFWQDDSDGLLFLFHLHGFTELARYASGDRTHAGDGFWRRVVESWLEDAARPRMPAWHPFPTSTRIVAFAGAVSAIAGWPRELRERLAGEIWREARYLRRALERDIGGNHLLKNVKALAVAGAMLPQSELLEPALRLLRREVSRQFLADGGHEERSTSYHREATHDLLEVVQVLERVRRAVPAWLSDAVRDAERWQSCLAGPDRRLPLLNDAWEGPPIGSTPQVPLSILPASGYTALRGEADMLIFDAGPVCPPHLPPHAHADVLSFVLWLGGRPLIVDPGSYLYTGPWRDRFRGTAAHNTVEVDGEDQCLFWGDFRAAATPRVRAYDPIRQDGALVLGGRHDGYRRLRDPVEHRRALVWLPGAGVVIVDTLAARVPHSIRSSLHLAPGIEPEHEGRLGSVQVRPLGEGAELRRGSALYSPYLGHAAPAVVLEDRRTVPPETPFGWSVLREGYAVSDLRGDGVTVTRAGEPPLTVAMPWCRG